MNIFRHIAQKRARPWFVRALATLAALYLMYRLARMFMKAAAPAANPRA